MVGVNDAQGADVIVAPKEASLDRRIANAGKRDACLPRLLKLLLG
jgi:hypothetical protein